jgi:DNA replication protein DnaC
MTSINDALENAIAQLKQCAVDNLPNCEKHGNADAYINGKCGKCVEHELFLKNQKLSEDIKSQMRIDARIPELYTNSTFDSYTCTKPEQIRVRDGLLALNKHKSVCLLGNTGAGKTHFGCALIRKAIDDMTFSDDFLEEIKRRSVRSASSPAAYVKFYQLLKLQINNPREFEALMRKRLLVIDEVGTSDTENKSNLLFQIVDERYDNMLQTMLISNLSPANFKAYISPPFYSRLVENFVIYDANWEDYRLIKKGS